MERSHATGEFQSVDLQAPEEHIYDNIESAGENAYAEVYDEPN